MRRETIIPGFYFVSVQYTFMDEAEISSFFLRNPPTMW